MRVLIADDELLLREGLARLLVEAGFEVVGKARTATDLIEQVATFQPDVAIVDIRMPPTHTDEGLAAAEAIRRDHPDVGVLVLSHHLESRYAMRLLKDRPAGVGYLLKERISDVEQFIQAVHQVAAGGTAFDPEVVTQLLARREPLAGLTPREHDVLRHIAEGRSNAAIAARLFITEKVVSKYINNIFAKLGMPPSDDDNRRVLAVLMFLDA
jgi:DNA-binding NarL/FixJ family response regulator